jgi:hypothetical protein
VDYRLDGDANVVIAQLPFAFEFGGAYTQVAVDCNGRLVFDPAHFSSNYAQQTLTPGYASVYLCWGDLIVSPGTVRYFITGQAPYRKFVVDYQDTILQTNYQSFSFSGILAGKSCWRKPPTSSRWAFRRTRSLKLPGRLVRHSARRARCAPLYTLRTRAEPDGGLGIWGGRPAASKALIIANSVIKLAGTATLYDNNIPRRNYPPSRTLRSLPPTVPLAASIRSR